MNLDSCTPDQRRSIQHVSGPLLVSAGAGSGKTFTLTQRIAYALLPESGPAAAGIHEVLAITFTEKAAAEIKARVKHTLRAEGLADEALKVDGAWISTIHGMCVRILRAHAFDLGIDPAFGIVGDAERADMIAGAVDAVLGEDNDIVARGSYGALFDEYKARSRMPSEPSVAAMLETLLDKAVGLRGGLAAVDFGPVPARASALARTVLLAYEQVCPALEQAGTSAAAERARAQAAEATGELEAFLAKGEGAFADSFAAMRELAAVLDRCTYLPCTFGNAAVKAEIKAYQAAHAHVARSCALALAYPLSKELLSLAHEVSQRYEQAKGAACKLDNDDLLVKTLDAFERFPAIAQRYENRFKLVMVDEFQDTSQLQIDMIARLAGPRFAHLCTVGDAQQSIYRFRGADVNVYEAHKRVMRTPEVDALYVELRKNFRSHADVLSFVDRVFEQPQVFGESFMSLAPHETRPSRFCGSGPRINLVLAMQPAGRNTGVSVEDAKRASARAIAQRFAALREQGHAPGDMVVLLGKMSRASVYAEELRAAGFECVVAGGSQFASAPEVQVVARFLEVLANPANTAALFEVLTSDMVRLSADDFLELATEEDPLTGEVRRRDLDRGFAHLASSEHELPERLAHAVRLMEHADRDARTLPASVVVREAVVRSGWMARLEGAGAAGMACAANVLKAVRLIEQLEQERGLGLASVARAFSDELAVGLKEAPGALSGAAGDVVKLMTIHASKGLEFPIVALADFAGAGARTGKLLVETCGSVARASLAAGASLDDFPQLAKRAAVAAAGESDDDDADVSAARRLVADQDACAGETSCSQAAYRAVLMCHAADEELAESRRKLYVGLTRASEALIVAMEAKAAAPGKAPAYPALVDDIRSALCGQADFPEGVAELPFGGSAPAQFERILVTAPEEAGSQADDAPAGRFLVPAHDGAPAAQRRTWNALRADVFSYSSIAPSHATPASESPEDGVLAAGGADEAASSRASEHSAAPGSASDAEKATGLGSAFHRAAQFAVETGRIPDEARIEALAAHYELSSDQRTRLHAACARWFKSTTYAAACACGLRRAEVPFFVRVDDVFMEGEIDLLCMEGARVGGEALVVDYKTGGTADESSQALEEKHRLQAQCYAYALLQQGYSAVELRFVRVEREDDAGAMQEVRYRFEACDVPRLTAAILAARDRCLASRGGA